MDYQHWEVYLASLFGHSYGAWSGTAPHVEVNYGAVTNLQLHVIAPLYFNAPDHGPVQYGYGDTELGLKYRLVDETTNCPMIGVFPLLEVPSGDADRGLGSGHWQAYFPVWIQKSFGDWLTYGGGGYWIHSPESTRNWWYAGWMLQRQVTTNLAIGTEIFHETAQLVGGESETAFNLGAMFDFTEHEHLLVSAGHSFQGVSSFQAYIAFQITFGPEKKDEK